MVAGEATVIFELFGAEMDGDTCPLAHVLVEGTFRRRPENLTPSADIIDQDSGKNRRCRTARRPGGFCRASLPPRLRPLFPASAYVRTTSYPRAAACSRMTCAWFSVEYFWCSVDMRTYSATTHWWRAPPCSALSTSFVTTRAPFTRNDTTLAAHHAGAVISRAVQSRTEVAECR